MEGGEKGMERAERGERKKEWADKQPDSQKENERLQPYLVSELTVNIILT